MAIVVTSLFCMPITITLSNAKGGVAKTTTAVNLAAGLALQNYKVLLIDTDFQANATQSLVLDHSGDCSLTELLTQPIDPIRTICKTHIDRLHIIPGSSELLHLEFLDLENKQFLLKNKLKLLPAYDFIIIDTSPSLNILSVNALAASDYIIIPTQPHFLSTVGLRLLLEFISNLKMFSSASVLGILLTRVDSKDKYIQESEEELRRLLPSIFKTAIPEHRFANRASASQQTLYEYSKRSKITRAYKEFVLEVLARLPN